MKLTKYTHACVVLEEQGQKLIIDPGDFTPVIGDVTNVAAVVVTHEHADHFSPGHLQRILDQNPKAQIFTTEEVATKFPNQNVMIAKNGDEHAAGPFNLHFTGDMHAAIHPDWPYPQNIGVRVGDAFYYSGDSLTPPDKPVQLLAVPANAPWAKVAESMDFLAAIKPGRCFPTHNALLSDTGNASYNRWLSNMCEKQGIGFTYLKPGESIKV